MADMFDRKHMEQEVNSYYADNARKLHYIVDKILLRFGGLLEKDRGDFYSLANEVFADVLKRYNKEQSFDGFLYSCLCNRIKTEITGRNRYKRMADRMSISMDTPIDDAENDTIGDLIPGAFSIERELFERDGEEYSEKMLSYLDRLSQTQKEVLRLMAAGYLPGEIKAELHMTEKQYSDCYAAIHSDRNVSVLY